MSNDVHRRLGASRPRLQRDQVAHEINQTGERLAVDLKVAGIQVVVAEHPQALPRVAGSSDQLQRRPWVDDDSVARKVLGIESTQCLGKVHVTRDRTSVVTDHVRRVVVMPQRFHILEDQPLVDVVLAPLVRVNRPFVETLVCNLTLVINVQSPESPNENQRDVLSRGHMDLSWVSFPGRAERTR